MPRTSDEKLDDSINVPVNKKFKRRFVALADREPNKPRHTAFARRILQEFVARREPITTGKQ